MRRLKIRHATRYLYATSTVFHEHRLLLRPREGHDIRVESSALNISPASTVLWHRDVYGNSVAMASFQRPAERLEIESKVVIQHFGAGPLHFDLAPYAATYPFQYDARERADIVPYQLPLFAKEEDAMRDWVGGFWSPGKVLDTVNLLDTINSAIPARLGYVRREEAGVQRSSETLQASGGSCRDLATLFIETCRHLGLAARFVSGYLYAPGLPAAQGATHAWGEVYLPGAGWRGYDSTTGTAVGGDHIAVAVSRHPENVPPVSGTFVSAAPGVPVMEVEVDVSLADPAR